MIDGETPTETPAAEQPETPAQPEGQGEEKKEEQAAA